MGKQTKLREAQRQAAELAIAARLRSRTKIKSRPFISAYAEFPPRYRARLASYIQLAQRPPESWQCQVRKRSEDERFLDLVRFVFARYPVARHLENAWIDDGEAEEANPDRPPFRYWYILVAQGRSLRIATQGFLSARETHHFLNAPAHVESAQTALWYAFARSATDDSGVALRIARTKLSAFPLGLTAWHDVARFFARHPTTIQEMNDLIDYFHDQWNGPGIRLAGRTLPALRRRLSEWHHQIGLRAAAGTAHWSGSPLPDVTYRVVGPEGVRLWQFAQIKTDLALYLEGRRMQHCVVTYRGRCLDGDISLWSLRSRTRAGKPESGLTLEVSTAGVIAQCRGFANRPPRPDEVEIVQRWAGDYGLRWGIAQP